MNIQQLNNILDFSIKESYKSDLKIPLWIWGLHGIGKTSVIKDWCKSNEVKCICLHTSTQDPGDLIGVPTVVDRKTIWGRPEWFPTEADGKTLIFLDELNRANQDVLQCMLPFALEGKLHTHTLPKQCVVVAAGNPDTEDYTVSSIDDKALLSRFGHICLNASQKGWADYVQKTPFDANLMNAVIKCNYEGFKMLQLSEFMEVEPDPRSLDLVGKKLSKMSKSVIETIGQDFVSMYLGTKYGVSWKKKREANANIFNGKRIKSDYKNIRKSIIIKMNSQNSFDMITAALDVIINDYATGVKYNTKSLDNVCLFILDSGEVGQEYIKTKCEFNGSFDSLFNHLNKMKPKFEKGIK